MAESSGGTLETNQALDGNDSADFTFSVPPPTQLPLVVSFNNRNLGRTGFSS